MHAGADFGDGPGELVAHSQGRGFVGERVRFEDPGEVRHGEGVQIGAADAGEVGPDLAGGKGRLEGCG